MNRNMENFSTFLAVMSGVAVVYFFHSVFYTSHNLLKTQTVFDARRHLPGSFYLLTRFVRESLRKTRGKIWKSKHSNDELVFALINCKCDDAVSLRRFCSVSGYGWDYPDSVFRDVPLCFPQWLFSRLLTMIVCSERFKLSPFGMLRVRETVNLAEPVDELKRGPFSLQVTVLEYRAVSAGVEVDLSLTASRHQTIWSSTLTLLSPKNTHTPDAQPDLEITHDPVFERRISLAFSWSTGVRCAWVFGDLCPVLFTLHSVNPLWMFSRCLAELEKHKGTDVVRAPLTASVCYKPCLVSFPRTFTIRISKNITESSGPASFSMEDHRTSTVYLSGRIKPQLQEMAQ